MTIQDSLDSLEGFFAHPGAVLIAFGALLFVVTFGVLEKIPVFEKNRGVAFLVSLILAALGIYYLNTSYTWLLTFSSLVWVVVLVVVGFIGWIFIRRFRKKF